MHRLNGESLLLPLRQTFGKLAAQTGNVGSNGSHKNTGLDKEGQLRLTARLQPIYSAPEILRSCRQTICSQVTA